ncbi:hypothetical protein FO519_005972 [Halicephalobus sp. NKZ332]|nr:hypothetical protein FO519_005972 [Halicephalobus sp. NKZ332]
MSSLSVDQDGAVASCSTSRSVGALSHVRQSPTTSIKSAGALGFRGSSFAQATKLEEDAGTNKSGMVTGFMALTKSGKKTYYAVLSDRCFELHDNQKSYSKKKKAARHIFDLATCFNINRHEDAKLKTSVSIMTPDETFVFKAAEEDKQRDDKATLEWFDAMMTAVVPARALYLGRPVVPTEFFEYCWDVVLVMRPRIRKPVPNPDNFENICSKRPELATRHRLGFYAHTIILCKMGTQPALSGHPKSGIPPFKTDNFIEIQRQFVASFGFQEKYFIMRIGRAAATGMCEIWAQCESEEVAANIHSRLNEIIEREAEKKRQNQQPSTPSSTHQLLSSPQNHSKDPSTSSSEASNSPKIDLKDGAISEIPSTSSLSSRKSILRNHYVSSIDDEEVPPHLETQKVVFNRSAISAKSIDQAILRDITRHEQKAVETQTRAHTIGSPSPSTSSWLNMLRRGNSQKKEEKNKPQFPTAIMSPVVEWTKHRASLVSGSSAPDDETEDSGGTLKVVDYEETDVRSNQPILVNGMFPHERLIEAALESHGDMSIYGSSQRGSISSSSDHDMNTRKRQMTIGSDSGKGEDLDHDIYNRSTPDDSSSIAADDSSLSDVIGCQRHFDEACSTTSSLSDHPEKASNSSGSVSHLLPPPTSEQQHLEDVRSYVSDSSDSCYSSINANAYLNPRAFSFSNNIVRNQGSGYEMMQPSKYPTIHGHKESRYSTKNSPIIQDEGSSSASTDGIQLGEEAATSAVISKSVRIQEGPSNQFLIPKDDLRKRAFSLGSPSWIIKPFKKLSHTPNRSAGGSKASSIAGDYENDCNESIASHRSHPETSSSSKLTYSMMEKRSDSVDSSSSHPSRKLSSTMKKKQNDLVELNFSPPSSSIIAQYNAIGSNKHSKDSVESPIRSRASSFATHRSNNSGKNSICGDPRKSIDQEDPAAEPQEMGMHEVRCFIQVGDDDLINILSSKDTNSLYSVKNDSTHFETIEENSGSPSNSRTSSRTSRRSLEPKSPTESVVSLKDRQRREKEQKMKIQPPINEVNYAIITTPISKMEERKASVPTSRKQLQKDQVKKTTSQERS